MSISNLSSPVQTYVQARSTLHSQIKTERLLGDSASMDNDQVTLNKDVACGGFTFKAGTSYSLNPYSDRDRSNENISFEKDHATTVIRHSYDPGFFSTEESLEVTSGGMNFSSFKLDNTSSGIKPDGWLQKDLERNQVEGFILAF
jgi:hypothetical protein